MLSVVLVEFNNRDSRNQTLKIVSTIMWDEIDKLHNGHQ